MDGSALRNRFGRALILLVVPAAVAAGFVVAGAGQPRRASSAGHFSTPVVIFTNSTPGTRVAEATIDGHQPPITATAGLLVVPGTVAPPEFENRH